ncbi:lipocalin-like domain-containing protein [Mycobacterium sp. 2YAF39]|uniref:lipocalin-like domain-containing protein n=1 Tax=Mycobacterium sp. 2YAF39 TaxID=3233033 RepID=UPI003F94E59D
MNHPQSDDWRRYPFRLVPGDPALDFPAAEADHPDCESDTWFLAGELTGESGRGYAFLSIFNKNRPGLGDIVADFYTFALFDLDAGTYGTYTDYDMPPANMQPGAVVKMSVAGDCLDLTYACDAGRSVWHTCRDEQGELVPYTYDVTFVGTDHAGESMRLDLHVTPSRAPVPLGADAHNGKIECFGQKDTYSYLQTGMTMTGTITWGSMSESVSGSAGHVDRQWFPLIANSGGAGGDVRWRAHEWRTINLDNGVDLSVWRQFDRTDHNALQPFSGATTCSPEGGADPEFADDVEVSIETYVRWPESVRTLTRPPAAARYLPDRHRLTSRALDLDLTGEPLVPAPAHGLPLEYMEGPYHYRGTLHGEPVSGFAFYERSLALYKDWELVDVLASVVGDTRVATLRELIDSGRRDEAVAHLRTDMPTSDPRTAQLVDDLVLSLSEE